MQRCALPLVIALLASPAACRKLELEPRQVFDVNDIFQEYLLVATTAAGSSSPTYTVEARFRISDKDGASVLLPDTDSILVNNVALKVSAASVPGATIYAQSLSSPPSSLTFVWSRADGTVFKNTISSFDTNLKVEAPPPTVSRSQLLLLTLAAPTGATTTTHIDQSSGKQCIGQIATTLSPAVVYTAASLTALDSGGATLAVAATSSHALSAASKAGGSIGSTQVFTFPISLTE